MSAAELLIIIAMSMIGMYVIIGTFYGFNHVSSITSRVFEVGIRERALRNKVSMYSITPAGAEYFAQLQEMHIAEAELLSEYESYNNNKTLYTVRVFILGAIFWTYYMYAIASAKQKAQSQKEGEEKTGV